MTMTVNSINTNIAAYYAQANIGIASSLASASVSRLSSGNRIVKSSDDVAALSTGTSLRTNVATLRTALVNASQGTSLLQIADGSLSQITEILQRQKAIALQAGSGSLTDSDRVFLNQEFQSLTSEIDRLTTSTNFNGVRLINGSLSDTARMLSNSTNSAQASLSVNFTVIADAGTFIMNGVTMTFTDAAPAAAGGVQRGGTIAQTLDNLVAYLNNANNDTSGAALSAANKALVTKAVYSRVGNSLVVTARAGGNLGEFFTINSAAMGTVTGTVNGQGSSEISTFTSIGVANIDTDVSATGTGDKFANNTITLDGVTLVTVANGDTIRSIVNTINAGTSTTGVSAYITGTANDYTINIMTTNTAATSDLAVGAAATGITINDAAATNNTQYLNGGGLTGLGQGSVIGVGSTGGSFSILTDQNQQYAQSTISFPDIAAGDLTATANFGTARTITIEGQAFTFTQTAKTARAQTEITIGATLQETLDNAVEAINSYFGTPTVNYALQQIEATRDGNSIIVRSKLAGNALDIAGGTLTVAASLMTGGSVSSADLSNTSNTGIDTKGVMNDDFIGVITGFNASYVSANKINLSVVVGGITYSAQNVSTNPSSNTDVRMISETGGYFDLKLRANQGVVVNDSAGANTFAERLNAAMSGVTFYQRRDVSSYAPSGNLLGSSVIMQLADFSSVSISEINVNAPVGSNPNGTISFKINDVVYSAQVDLRSQLGAYSVTRFISATNANDYLEFRNGATALSMATSTAAAAVEAALKEALGVGEGAAALSFQIGTTSTDTLEVSIGSATSDSLFSSQTLNVLSQANAAAASAVLDQALATVTSLRAGVGALQSRFNFASANIQISIQNQDAARGELLDTDIASESTNYATFQVKLQAGISVLAQANQQLQSLLKLIG
jgi:flagellin